MCVMCACVCVCACVHVCMCACVHACIHAVICAFVVCVPVWLAVLHNFVVYCMTCTIIFVLISNIDM